MQAFLVQKRLATGIITGKGEFYFELFCYRWGRRAALVTSGAGAGFLGLCKSFAGSYPLYLVAEFLETVFGASVYPAAFVLSKLTVGYFFNTYTTKLIFF